MLLSPFSAGEVKNKALLSFPMDQPAACMFGVDFTFMPKKNK